MRNLCAAKRFANRSTGSDLCRPRLLRAAAVLGMVRVTWLNAQTPVVVEPNPELTCQHADSETLLKAGGASLEVKTFVFRGTLEQLLVKIAM